MPFVAVFIFLFGRPQKIDFWLLGADLAIVVLIVWLDVPDKFHKKTLTKRVASLVPYMREGQELQRDVPALEPWRSEYAEASCAWTIKANHWTNETSKFLALHSKMAETVFLLVTKSKELDRAVYSPQHGSVHFVGELGDSYQMLLSRLDSLRRIMEKPEVYF